uniref:Uncharacterized protein n=1 Tax=Pipistrellus kuhlii TaxID=59472 RepID=A0A7J7SUU2_PIPKU|nr:hypothetical protein mPipKuh1_009770 [Pipistrellus kuhlii]
MCVGPNLRHPEQVVLTESKSLAQKGRSLANRCAGGAAEGSGKGRSHRPGWEQTLSQRSPPGEPEGWAQARKELNLMWGFVVWVMHFELKIEIDVFMQLGSLSLCFLIVTSGETNLGSTDE